MKRPIRRDGKTAKKSRAKSAIAKRSTRAQSATFRDLLARVGALERELTEAREQQTATSEVLGVVSRSPGDLKPVFAAMLANIVRVCNATLGSVYRVEDGVFRFIAMHNTLPAHAEISRDLPFLPSAKHYFSRMIASKKVDQIADFSVEPGYLERRPEYVASVEVGRIRTALFVPMLKGDELIGAFALARQEVRPFSDKQIDLVQNFAAQAVIAIENTRLLNELHQRTDDLSESLEQQTATSEVLQVISSSPTDAQPVFDMIANSVARLCKAQFCHVFRFDGERIYFAASHGLSPEAGKAMQGKYPMLPGRGTAAARSIVSGAIEEIPDVHADPDYEHGDIATIVNYRGIVAVPILKEGVPIGSIAVARSQIGYFPKWQIKLLQSFADQAVIAIENVRLFDEVQQRTEDLAESLQQQTATSDVLKVISRSTFDLQTVLETLTESAARLCQAEMSSITRQQGTAYYYATAYGFPPELNEFLKSTPHEPGRGSVIGRTVLECKPVHVPDVTIDAEYTMTEMQEKARFRTVLGVPLLREGRPIGVITLLRSIVHPFNENEIGLVTTFADQAVIAIENVRLFDEVQARTRELTESLEYQTATSDVLNVISRSPSDLEPVLDAIVQTAARLCSVEYSFIAKVVENKCHLVAGNRMEAAHIQYLANHPVAIDRSSVIGRVALERKSIHVPDVLSDPEFKHLEWQKVGKQRTVLGVPLLREDAIIGVIILARTQVEPFTEKQIELVSTFADQAVIAIENVRLFDEIQETSRQLAEASQHKSQFLANMSHELRTPLNAIIGYTELILDGIYGETPEKTLTVLKRVESNGRHLLGLINDVLDFSKIEAGQLKLALADYSMKDVVHKVYSAVEPLAAKKNLGFKLDVPPDMPAGHGDEQKLTQVLLNLVGDAIKFTNSGAVAIKVTTANGSFSVAVHDTGPGIDPANQEKLFEEFQQADNSITKAKGSTWLGLAISRRIVEMHGGRLWVDSSPGNGAVFTFTIPTVVEQASPS